MTKCKRQGNVSGGTWYYTQMNCAFLHVIVQKYVMLYYDSLDL